MTGDKSQKAIWSTGCQYFEIANDLNGKTQADAAAAS
jgi:hypothetical protein